MNTYIREQNSLSKAIQYENNLDIYKGPDPNIEYFCSNDAKSKGFTLLMKWVLLTKKCPHLNEKIKNYIKSHPKEINKKNEKGWTALMLASLNSRNKSNEETVKILIDAQCNLNLQNNNGWTALMMASRCSGSESTEGTVKMLIDAKCI